MLVRFSDIVKQGGTAADIRGIIEAGGDFYITNIPGDDEQTVQRIKFLDVCPKVPLKEASGKKITFKFWVIEGKMIRDTETAEQVQKVFLTLVHGKSDIHVTSSSAAVDTFVELAFKLGGFETQEEKLLVCMAFKAAKGSGVKFTCDDGGFWG